VRTALFRQIREGLREPADGEIPTCIGFIRSELPAGLLRARAAAGGQFRRELGAGGIGGERRGGDVQ